MTIGDLISFNLGFPCDSIRVIYNEHVILDETRMYAINDAWLHLNIDKYYVYPDEDNFTSVIFTVYLKEIKRKEEEP